MMELTGALLLVGHYAEAAARGMEAETYASKHGLGGRQGTLAMILVAQALDALGRWEDATAALARALQYEHDGFIEIGLRDENPVVRDASRTFRVGQSPR